MLLKPSQPQKEEIVGEYNAQIMDFYPASNGKAAPKIFSPAGTQDFVYRKGNSMFLGILVSCEMAQPVLQTEGSYQGAIPLTAESYLV